MTLRAAQPGDLFLLLLPTADPQATPPIWQTEWQARYGGNCTQPLHVSIQRFTCTDPAQLPALADALQMATTAHKAIPVAGIALQPLLSGFRQNLILKCRLQQNAALHALSDLTRAQLTQQNLIPDFPWYPDLITVLEDIDPIPVGQILLPTPQPLFIGNELLLSRVIARNTYLPIRQWQLLD